jgi:GAF domain-containing protein
VRLVALDGGSLGSIQLYEKVEGEFTAVDEATVVHLAQMAAAAIDRVRLFAGRL